MRRARPARRPTAPSRARCTAISRTPTTRPDAELARSARQTCAVLGARRARRSEALRVEGAGSRQARALLGTRPPARRDHARVLGVPCPVAGVVHRVRAPSSPDVALVAGPPLLAADEVPCVRAPCVGPRHLAAL